MARAKLQDVLINKAKGERWFTMQAPEELHMWNPQKPWEKGTFKNYGVKLASVRLSTVYKIHPKQDKFTIANPLWLKCGIPVHSGTISITQAIRASILLRVDSSVEIQEAMEDIMDIMGNGEELQRPWIVAGLSIFTKDKEVLYTRLNPDSTGIQLYLECVKDGKVETFYPNLSFSEQNYLVGDFCNKLASCELGELPTQLKSKCSIELANKKTMRKYSPKTSYKVG